MLIEHDKMTNEFRCCRYALISSGLLRADGHYFVMTWRASIAGFAHDIRPDGAIEHSGEPPMPPKRKQ